MKLELIKEDFPLTSDERILSDVYTDSTGCAIAKALRRNKVYFSGVSGWGSINTSSTYHDPTIIYDSDKFKELNKEFMNGREEPFILDYPTLKKGFLANILRFF